MESIEPQLKKFISKTTEGKIDWVLINPNAVRWVKTIGNRTTTSTLQAQGGLPNNPASKNFVFTIQNNLPPTVILQINTVSDGRYKELLSQLFEIAIQTSKNTSGKFLDDLLDSI